AAGAILATHLSRLAEELVLWTSEQFRFVRLSDAFTTGSSIMPQKRNPDAAELVRGKAGRPIGALIALLTMLKGLPLAYGKDMQEDKEPVFDATDSLALCVAATAGMIADMTVDAAALRRAAEGEPGRGFITATDLADWLVATLGLPFRDAHHVVGAVVSAAEARGVRLEELDLAALQAIEPRIDARVFDVLPVDAAMASRTSFGGAAPARVREAIAAARARWLEPSA
ncbi:MAG: lyase family protein, partial [Pseudomonadota bacterium]